MMADEGEFFHMEGGCTVDQITEAFLKFVPKHTKFSHMGQYLTDDGETCGYVFFNKNPGPSVSHTSLKGRFTIPIVAALLVKKLATLPFKPSDGGIAGMTRMWMVEKVDIVKGCISVRAFIAMAFPDETSVH
jgi:hypothetical protein